MIGYIALKTAFGLVVAAALTAGPGSAAATADGRNAASDRDQAGRAGGPVVGRVGLAMRQRALGHDAAAPGTQSEFECVCRALGEIGQRRVFVEVDSVWRSILEICTP